MNQLLSIETKTSLVDFFRSTDVLIEQKIIRSSKYSADIAEYICSKLFDLELNENQREIGYDAINRLDNRKIQIKINNSQKKTNQDIGNKNLYDDLYLIVTSNSKLFDPKYKNAFFVIYTIPSSKIISEKYISKTFLRSCEPKLILNENFEQIN